MVKGTTAQVLVPLLGPVLRELLLRYTHLGPKEAAESVEQSLEPIAFACTFVNLSVSSASRKAAKSVVLFYHMERLFHLYVPPTLTSPAGGRY